MAARVCCFLSLVGLRLLRLPPHPQNATQAQCTDIRALTALYLIRIIEPHAVDLSDGVEETEDDAILYEVGPSGGAGGSGGSAAAVVRINADWSQTVTAYSEKSTETRQCNLSIFHLRPLSKKRQGIRTT